MTSVQGAVLKRDRAHQSRVSIPARAVAWQVRWHQGDSSIRSTDPMPYEEALALRDTLAEAGTDLQDCCHVDKGLVALEGWQERELTNTELGYADPLHWPRKQLDKIARLYLFSKKQGDIVRVAECELRALAVLEKVPSCRRPEMKVHYLRKTGRESAVEK